MSTSGIPSWRFFGDPILERERCNAVRLQPSSDLIAFEVDGERDARSAGCDHDAGSGRGLSRRQKDR
jgi:hypothetical protein